MKANMGKTDKTIRLVAAAAFAGLYFGKIVTGNAGIVMLVIAGIFILTSLVSFCPLYTLFGFSTCKTEKNP